MKKKLIIWLIVIAVVIAAVVLLFSGRKQQLTFKTVEVATETIETTVMATGYIQPVEEVEVGTQVSGVIEKIYVDYNSTVKAGQLLAELDKSTLMDRLTQAKASVASAKSDLLYAEQNYARVKQLHDVKAATDVSLEEATNRQAQAKTVLTNAKASESQALVNLNYAYIYSPINGVVLDRKVNVGQTVAASFNTPTLFNIAEDLTKMQVEVDVDEADIGQVRVGQAAVFTVDAYPADKFEGVVSQIRLQPTVTNNVVTYVIIVDAPNPEQKLFPGMTASIIIKVESETGLTVPVEAMNFYPTAEMFKELDRIAPEPLGNGRRSVWVKTGDTIERRPIETGIGDGINVIVLSGVKEGEEVVLSAAKVRKSENGKATRNPLMPARPPRAR